MALEGKRVLILVDNIYEDMELQYPRYRLLEEKIEVHIAGPKAGETYKGKYGYPCVADMAFTNAYASDYQGLIIPGGFAPDRLRRDPHVLSLTKQMNEEGKLLAFICHAGWVPISAGIMRGVKCTSTPAIRDDLVNAGAEWVDESVVIDGHRVSSRCPEDLPNFCRGIFTVLQSESLMRR